MDFKTGKTVEIVKEFLANGGDKFEINHFFEDYESKKDETKFEISLDKSFEMHEVDLDKIKETIDKNYNFDINEIKKDYEREF